MIPVGVNDVDCYGVSLQTYLLQEIFLHVAATARLAGVKIFYLSLRENIFTSPGSNLRSNYNLRVTTITKSSRCSSADFMHWTVKNCIALFCIDLYTQFTFIKPKHANYLLLCIYYIKHVYKHYILFTHTYIPTPYVM